jgi:hypothetical protein
MAKRTSRYYKKNPKARKRRLKQQSRYQKTPKGRAIKKGANKLRRKLKLKVGDERDAAHYKDSKTKGRPQSRSKNRSRLKIRRPN